MALFPEPGSWRGFLEQVSGTGTQFGNDETQPPSPQPPSPEIEMDDVPVPNAPTIHVDLMTLDELLLAPGRSDLPKLHPKRVNGAGWYVCHVYSCFRLIFLSHIINNIYVYNIYILIYITRFEYTKGITKSIKKIMENDFPVAAPNWTLLSSDTKERWFKAFAVILMTHIIISILQIIFVNICVLTKYCIYVSKNTTGITVILLLYENILMQNVQLVC